MQPLSRNTHELLFELCVALVTPGRVLVAHEVTAGCGCVIDWRDGVGTELIHNADAFEVARAFLKAVGWMAAAKSLEDT